MTFSIYRKKGQTVRIIDKYTDEEVCTIDIAALEAGRVKLGIDASQQYLIVRGEQDVKKKENSKPPIDRSESKSVGYFNDYDDEEY